MNVGKVAADRMAVTHVDLCPDGDRQIVRQIYSDVAGRGFERGIVVTASPSRGQQLHNDSPSRSLRRYRRRSVQLDTAAAGLGLHPSFRGSQPNAACARLDLRRSSDFAQFHAPAAGRRLHAPAALAHANTPPAGLQHRALEPGNNHYVSRSTFRLDLALGGGNFDVSSTRLQSRAASHASDLNRAPTGFRRDLAADVVEVNISTTTLEVDTSGNPGRACAAAAGLDLGGFQVSRHIDDKIIGALMFPSA